MNHKTKQIQILLSEQDHNILYEMSEEKRLSISTLARMLIIEHQEFIDMEEELFKSEMNNIEQIQKLDNLSNIFDKKGV